ncbi:Crp/Fnr family transcriptional regulator [Pedobacter sp. KBS0701]|nr:Crp/Fnr family transcriptional regulator [Pedobacter sp. KBS0701]QDW23444.1 Crp/Fnr family transcriptional regulator [Pedobacter sp. KBS0701]
MDAYIGSAHELTIKKTKFVLSPLHANECMYFIVKGLLRSFIRHRGKDITTRISLEDEFVCAISNPAKQEKYSVEYIQAMENCILIAIPYVLLDSLYDRFPESNIIGRKLMAIESFKASERANLARIPKASDRYEILMKNYPKIFNRMPLHYLASYLGMRNETLSRVRGSLYTL